MFSSFQFSDTRIDILTHEQKIFLAALAGMKNCGVTVFDLYLRKHIFISYNFPDLFGYNINDADTKGNEYFNSRVHPNDIDALFWYGLQTLAFLVTLPAVERNNHKMIIEYRILGKDEKYVRVIEQHQAFTSAQTDEMRLSLGVIDLSPDQEELHEVKCIVNNFATGHYFHMPKYSPASEKSDILSKREKEVLQLIGEGLLSKEISDKLSISVHTVNTHRQRILEKLQVQTSIEALSIAAKLKLIENS